MQPRVAVNALHLAPGRFLHWNEFPLREAGSASEPARAAAGRAQAGGWKVGLLRCAEFSLAEWRTPKKADGHCARPLVLEKPMLGHRQLGEAPQRVLKVARVRCRRRITESGRGLREVGAGVAARCRSRGSQEKEARNAAGRSLAADSFQGWDSIEERPGHLLRITHKWLGTVERLIGCCGPRRAWDLLRITHEWAGEGAAWRGRRGSVFQ